MRTDDCCYCRLPIKALDSWGGWADMVWHLKCRSQAVKAIIQEAMSQAQAELKEKTK